MRKCLGATVLHIQRPEGRARYGDWEHHIALRLVTRRWMHAQRGLDAPEIWPASED